MADQTQNAPNESESMVSTLVTRMAEVQREEINTLFGKAVDELREMAKPDAGRTIDVTPTQDGDQPIERVAPITTRDTREPLYRRMSAELAYWRNPESDHWMAQWFRSLAHKNQSERLQAESKLEVKYGRAATTYTEGVPSPTGGYPDGTGGALIPVPVLNVIMIERDQVAKIPGLSTAIALTAQQARIPTVGSFVTEMVGEGATADEAGPTMATVLPRANKMQGVALATQEMLDDSAYNTVGILAQRAGSSMGQLEDVQACQTAGTAPEISNKIIDGVTLGAVDDGTGFVLEYVDLVNTYFAVPQQYRMDGVWYGNDVALKALTTINSGIGYPVFSTQSTVPGAITDDSADGFVFRKPVYEVPLVSPVTTNGTGCLLFMSRSGYGWGRRQGITAAASDGPGFLTDTWTFKFTQRVEGINLDAEGRAGLQDFN